MSYPSAVEFLYDLQLHGIKLGLDNIRVLLSALGQPHMRFRTIHIGGTNGKGSTAAMVSQILEAAGYRVGLYTSPHLIDFRERIRINGAPISEGDVTILVAHIRRLVPPELAPTFFEFTTALALLYFAQSHVDVAVLEVGMGGRFDATNVVTPVASAITTVSLDHEEFLGHTLEQIAFEKAGISKSGVPLVIGRLPAPAVDVVRRVAGERGTPLCELNRTFHVVGADPTDFNFQGQAWRLDHLQCGLRASYQMDNVACALALLETAASLDISISGRAVREGLAQVRWPGRFEAVDQSPTVIVDGAHNPEAAHALAQELIQYRVRHVPSQVVVVLGMMRDKQHQTFLKTLLPAVDHVVLTQAAIPRAATVDELALAVRHLVPSAHLVPLPGEALAMAKRLATPDGLVCVTGSLMLVGDVKAFLHGVSVMPVRG